VRHNLIFSALHLYDAGEPGITLPVGLRNGASSVDLIAKLDTGASYCIFRRDYVGLLGIDLETGAKEIIGTANSFFIAYGHEVTILALGFEFQATVYFAEDYSVTRNVLGRQGWLDRIKLGLVDYDGELYVGDYNDDSGVEA
jgi:hypothetical protein